MKKTPIKYPKGWNAKRIKDLAEHYEKQSQNEVVAEDEAAYRSTRVTMRAVPVKLEKMIEQQTGGVGRARRSCGVYYGQPDAYHYQGILAAATHMGFADAKENQAMKCSIAGCPGEYERKEIVQTVRHGGRIIVIDRVPAEVCAVCGDVLLSLDAARHIQRLLSDLPQTQRTAPLYEYV